MAKLKAPLLSLGASGAIGKALVYLPWKGLDCVREYVVPANPKTTGQTTQRSYLTAAVTAIHTSQALPAGGINATDIMANALWGSTFATPRTWFNQIVKNWIDQKVASLIPIIWQDGVLTPAANQITLKLGSACESSLLTNAEVYWGTSKTALINKQAVTRVQLNAGVAITGMVTKTKYFLQVRPTLPVGFIGSYSGTYYDTTT